MAKAFWPKNSGNRLDEITIDIHAAITIRVITRHKLEQVKE